MPGWKRKRPLTAKAEVLPGLLAAVLLATAAGADESPPDEPKPDPGLLEFLGLLVEEGDDYLDPLDLAVDDWKEAGHQAAAEARPESEPRAVEDEDEPQD